MTLADLARWADNRVNPIVVKELRQAVRSRLVIVGFIVFLAVQLVAVWLYTVATGAGNDLEGGAGASALLFALLFLSCSVFIPILTGFRLAVERSPAQLDLMYSTALTAGRVVRGKLLSAAVLALLAFSAAAPFITFTYLLRGVDLPSVFITLGLAFLYIMAATQFAIFLASVPTSLPAKVGLGLVGLACLLVVGPYMGFMIFAAVAMSIGMGGGTSLDMILALVGTAAVMLWWLGLLYLASVAVLSPPSSNRTRGLRLYVTAIWALTGVVAGFYAGFSSNPDAWVAMAVWAITWTVQVGLFLLVGISERTSWNRRIRRDIPRGMVRRALALLTTSGAPGGILHAVLLEVLTVAAAVAVLAAISHPRWYAFFQDDEMREAIQIAGGLGAYFVAFCLTAWFLVQVVRTRRGPLVPHQSTWVMAGLLGTVATFAPLVGVGILSYAQGRFADAERFWWTYVSPALLADDDGRGLRAFVGAAWAGLALMACAPRLIRQMGGFRPLETSRAAPSAPPPAAPAVPDQASLSAPSEAPADTPQAGPPGPVPPPAGAEDVTDG